MKRCCGIRGKSGLFYRAGLRYLELAIVPGLQLTGLDPAEACQLLISMSGGPVTLDTAAAIVRLLGTSPLTIRLAARLLAGQGQPGELFALDVRKEQVDAELYRRVLGHIEDPEVRKLAHPGLVLRRLTADVIGQVLARTCGVAIGDDQEARSLLERLGHEAMLVELDPGPPGADPPGGCPAGHAAADAP